MLKSILLTSAAAAAVMTASAADATDFTFTGAIDHWVVPRTGLYEILAFGAQGGGKGGLGAEAGGDLTLTAGSVVSILVGGQGGTPSKGGAGGGGGGSFVALGATPLVVAGGGAGYAFTIGSNPGVISRSGGGYGGGTHGAGGHLVSGCDSGAGGGFRSNGVSCDAAGGAAFLNGGAGGAKGAGAAAGGFGGGGASRGRYSSGGGGGYSGGGPGWYSFDDGDERAGGGGSYVADAAKGLVLKAGLRRGDGEILINLLAAAVPEPATWVSMITGFGLLGLMLRRRLRRASAA